MTSVSLGEGVLFERGHTNRMLIEAGKLANRQRHSVACRGSGGLRASRWKR